jgi:hypothetical protein
MKRYKILGWGAFPEKDGSFTPIPLVLTFIEGRDPKTYMFTKAGGLLECDGSTVWFVEEDGTRIESITDASVINLALELRCIEEIV